MILNMLDGFVRRIEVKRPVRFMMMADMFIMQHFVRESDFLRLNGLAPLQGEALQR